MAVVNFHIPDTVNKRVNVLIKKKGFTSKAEFYRFLTMKELEEEKMRHMSDDEKLTYTTKELEKAVIAYTKTHKILSLEEQLADWDD